MIQHYVKKQIQKLKLENGQNPDADRNMNAGGQPVILNSIHNDGMALDTKIKDILKWKMEAYEAKWR